MIDDVYLLIQGLTNYTVPDTDTSLIQYLWNATETELKAMTNQETLPEGLDPLHVRMTVGRYIRSRIADMSGEEGTRVVSSITEGKVTVQLTGQSTAERLSSLANVLIALDKELIACFRKLRW